MGAAPTCHRRSSAPHARVDPRAALAQHHQRHAIQEATRQSSAVPFARYVLRQRIKMRPVHHRAGHVPTAPFAQRAVRSSCRQHVHQAHSVTCRMYRVCLTALRARMVPSARVAAHNPGLARLAAIQVRRAERIVSLCQGAAFSLSKALPTSLPAPQARTVQMARRRRSRAPRVRTPTRGTSPLPINAPTACWATRARLARQRRQRARRAATRQRRSAQPASCARHRRIRTRRARRRARRARQAPSALAAPLSSCHPRVRQAPTATCRT